MLKIIAYIGIGSNLGTPEKNCTDAIKKISHTKDIKVIARSSFYKTEPIGEIQQNWFINSVVKIETGLPPIDLLSTLLGIESVMGRVRKEKWGPRLIDLDLLFYDNIVFKKKGISLPHPEIQKRKFVLTPMSEISESFIHPVLKKTIKTLLQESLDTSVIKKI